MKYTVRSIPSLEVRYIFLDLSKAFDKVWHQGLLFKLESFGIRGKLLNLLEDYFSINIGIYQYFYRYWYQVTTNYLQGI